MMTLHLRPAPKLRLANAAIHLVVAVLLLAALPNRGWPLFALAVNLLVLVLVLVSAWHIDGVLALRLTSALRVLRQTAEGWALGVDEASLQTVRLLPGTTVTAALVVLRWRTDRKRRGHLLLVAEMLGQDDYRRLCRQLWQQHAKRPPPVN